MTPSAMQKSLQRLKVCGRYIWVQHVFGDERRAALKAIREVKKWPKNMSEYELLQRYFDRYLWDKMLERLDRIKKARQNPLV